MSHLGPLLCLCLAASANAAPSKAGALAKEADRLYKENRYKEAAQTLNQAYAIDPAPLYLYNIARAYDQAGDLEQSLDTYRKYVGLPSTETQPELVRKANLAMDRLRTLVAKNEADRKFREAEKLRLEQEAQKAQASSQAEAAEARRQRDELQAQERARQERETKTVDTRKVVAFVAGGTAIAAYGASIGFAIAAANNRAAFRDAQTLATKQKYEAATRTTAAVTDISLLVGIAATVTAIIAFPKDGLTEPKSTLTVVVAPLAGGAMAGLDVRF